jgi:hypothetical protein
LGVDDDENWQNQTYMPVRQCQTRVLEIRCR